MTHMEGLRSLAKAWETLVPNSGSAILWAVRVIEAARNLNITSADYHQPQCVCERCQLRRLLAEGGE